MKLRACGIWLVVVAFTLLALSGCRTDAPAAVGDEAAPEEVLDVAILPDGAESGPVCQSYGGAAPTVSAAADGSSCDGCTCVGSEHGVCACDICAAGKCPCGACAGGEEEPDDALPNACSGGDSWSGSPMNAGQDE